MGHMILAQATPDDEFWFYDGNIILVADNVKFRVYKGLLASRSGVFRDMFSLPQPSSPTCTSIDKETGCPFTVLDDSPDTFRHILRVCMPPSKSSLFEVQHPSFETIWACIHLGDKYDMSHIYEQAHGYLKHYFPSEFSRWNQLRVTMRPPGFRKSDAIGVVNLALGKLGDCTILPVALLACTTLDGKLLVEGVFREDGIRETLDRKTLATCVGAKEKVFRATQKTRLDILTCKGLPPACQSSKENLRCTSAFERLFEKAIRNVTDLGRNPVPKLCDMFESDLSDACKDCRMDFIHRELVERIRLWNRLPELFEADFPGWDPEPDGLVKVVSHTDDEEPSNHHVEYNY
ncbi:hypothetical protein C8Q74DRAFT_330261 [Fomes fomentarius]|nr:hypothetical protein C8Q74DRAFT_330261 [Fomes fomentarius]